MKLQAKKIGCFCSLSGELFSETYGFTEQGCMPSSTSTVDIFVLEAQLKHIGHLNHSCIFFCQYMKTTFRT